MCDAVVPSVMLDIQYRMHPTISRFPSHEFYDRAVRDGTVDAHGVVSPALLPPRSSLIPQLDYQDGNGGDKPSVVFLDHVGSESMKDRSRVNWSEASIVCSLVEDLLLKNPVSSFYLASMAIHHRCLPRDQTQETGS